MSMIPAMAKPGGTTPDMYRQEVRLIFPQSDDPAIAAMARRGICICRPGQPVAHRANVPATGPRDPRCAPLAELRLGKFVAWDEKSDAYISRKAGHACLSQGRLEVEDTLELHEDIDGATGPVAFDGHLIVFRSVLDSAVLTAAGNLTVHGTIEAAEVHSGGDLHVLHGICGKDRGRATVHGRLTARFITNARVTAGGDMVIANEIVNSHLTCGGVLKVEHGTILAGHAIVIGGIVCHTAGSDAGTTTILESGLAPDCYATLKKTVAEAESCCQKAHEIRSAVEPLMVRAKSLTAAQKEKATELLYAADEAEAHAKEALASLEHSRTSMQTCLHTRISVGSELHPGVIIRFPIAEALVTTRLRGPLEIVLCVKGGETHIAAVDRCRNASIPLHSLPSADGRAEFARRFLAGPAPAQ